MAGRRAKSFALLAAGLAVEVAVAAAAENVDDGGTKTQGGGGQQPSDAIFTPGQLTRLFLLVIALSIPAGIIGFFAWKLMENMKSRERKKEEKKKQKQHKSKQSPSKPDQKKQ